MAAADDSTSATELGAVALVAAVHGLWTFVDTSLEQVGADRLEQTRDQLADILRMLGHPIEMEN